PIQPRHRDLVPVLLGLAALKARTLGKVVRTDRLIVVVGQCGGGRTVPMAFLAVAFPAFHFCEEFFPVFDAVHRQGRFRRHADGRARLFVLPAWRKGLDEGHQVGALLVGQRLPGRHIGVIEAARDSLDEDLFEAITRGFYNTYMPSWKALTNQQRADLVAFIKTFSPRWQNEKPGTPISMPPEPALTVDSIKHGKELFAKMECWKCHGQEGHGDGPSAATLTDNNDQPIRPYNFSEGSRFKCGETNQDLYKIFMTGLDGTPMPSFADNLKTEEAWDLVHFLRTLQVHHNSPELALWRNTEQPGLKPTNPGTSGGAPPEKAETVSAPPPPGASSPAAQGASAPSASDPAPAAAGKAGKARAGATNPAPAPPAAEPQPATTPASGSAKTSAANPAPVQPVGEPKPGTITSGGGAESASANPVSAQATVPQPPR